jgi:SAM-dependent methyltransferase
MPGLSADDIRDVNTRYHDVAADGYDGKWGIDFGPSGRTQVLGKLRKALGREPGRYDCALEIGAGTGYFSLNLVQAGIIGQPTCSDISEGMLSTLRVNADTLGIDVETVVGDAERLPFADGAFDLVLGHAVLHHIPHLPLAFAEFMRVLRPGGTLVFAGEPSHYGDRIAALPKRGAMAVAPLWRAAIRASAVQRPGAGNGSGADDHALEHFVDVHAFTPAQLARFARGAGFERVNVRGEELLANWFGWANRALESTAEPSEVPWVWRQYAYRGYLLLQQLDRRLLESRLPAGVFYNLMLAARKPL